MIKADAKNLPFRDNSFDLVIEKGTVDGLLCCEDKLRNEAMIVWQECVRVCKKNCLLVSNGCPNKRFSLFSGLKCDEILYAKQPLSDQADLINCLNSVGITSSKEIVLGKREWHIANLKCIFKRQNK